MIDYRRVDQLAQQRAKLIADYEAEEHRNAPTWYTSDNDDDDSDDSSGGFTYVQ